MTTATRGAPAAPAGVAPFHFCPPDVDPFDTVEWSRRTAFTDDHKTKTRLFEQADVEAPAHWSQNAVNVVASKYFYGRPGTPARETSVRQVAHRQARTIADWGVEGGYFSAEAGEQFYRDLVWLILHQYAAFNSPVWFNLGLHQQYGATSGGGSVGYRYDPDLRAVMEVDPLVHAQCSACFILKMKDGIDDIWNLAGDAARLFKGGSGVGTDLSPLRSKYENLSGGGLASGAISFGKLIDTTGGTIKSGGRTRRAAIMLTLKDWHPEFREFVRLKMDEEAKAKALIRAGYDPDFNGEAYGTVGFQNANLSVRLTDEFMNAALTGQDWQTYHVTDRRQRGPRFKADDALRDIAKGTWVCGDPGAQFETTIQRWHTCPNTEPINSSNPCSEYKFLDDTACNLASLRLTAFRRPDGTIDLAAYRAAVRLLFTAQEILVGNASYPTRAVAERSYQFRPLGIGYADLGALLMLQGLAYDSDEGRALGGLMTAVLTGEAYLVSAEMAAVVGPFEGYEENREPMLAVMRMHRASLAGLQGLPAEYVAEAYDAWDRALVLGQRVGFRNAQASVLAPTGTISFAMDCATTGIEPELGLVKYKILAGGGSMKIVNPLVGEALATLGYDRPTRDRVVEYVEARGGVEGCPDLAPHHLAVFDTSFAMPGGKRSIHWKAHVDMMAAAQPFVSGAISKTVNLPADCTEEEIRDAIVDAWRKGLKAVAMYRDGSKWSQPLSTSDGGNNSTGEKAVAPFGSRRKLPKTRAARVHHFNVGGHDGYVIPGLYEDGTLGELFIKMSKEGSTISGLMDTVGILASIGLQHGVPLDLLVDKLKFIDFEPRGFTGDRDIPIAKSIIDYVFRWLGNQYTKAPDAPPDRATALPPTPPGPVVTGPACPTCGNMTVRAGKCFSCPSGCGSIGGCDG